jgi:hypothetical protein
MALECSFWADAAVAGANLVAIGQYSEIPFARAEGQISLAGKEVVYSFDDPNLDFGRVVVRSTEPLSVVRRDLFVGYVGAGLAVDTRASGGGNAARISEVEFWLRIEGSLEGGRRYEWEFEGGSPENEIEGGFPAIIPMLWADGEPMGAEVTVADPVPEDSDRIQRLLIPRGIVEVPAFERQTGSAWIVLKPRNFGNAFVVQRMSLREVENSPDSAGASRMPIPVRYVPIKSALEDQIAEVMQRCPPVLKALQREDGAFGAEQGDTAVANTSIIAAALRYMEPDAESTDKACEWLAQQAPAAGQTWPLPVVSVRLWFMANSCSREKHGAVMRKDVDVLTQAQTKDGGWPEAGTDTAGGRREASAPRAGHLATASAMDALMAAESAGIETDDRLWKAALAYWTEAQSYGGGFTDRLSRYGGVGQVTSTGYTGVGAGFLLMALDVASSMGGKRCGTYLASAQQLRVVDAAFEWLDQNYSKEVHEAGSFTTGYNPYIKPQASILLASVSGMTHFDDQSILREAAAGLMEHYDQATSMFGVRGPQGFAAPPSPGLTAVALVNLSYAAAPIVCQRMVLGDDEKGWAQYSMDVPHLVRYLARKRGGLFNWRRTDIDRDVREIAEVPITVVRVQGDFEWTTDEWNKLREYCLVGGTVLFDVSPEAKGVKEKVQSSLAATFPEYKLADVPANDPLLEADSGKITLPNLQGISNGFRYFVLLPPESWSCHWQLNQVKEQEASFAFMDRLLAYVTDGTDPRSSFAPSPYEVGAASTKNMTAARIQVGGDVPVYPSLVDAMNRLLQANYRMEIKEAGPEAADLVWVNVAGPGKLEGDAGRQILSAVKSGKFVLADVISGNEAWAEEFEGELKKLDGKLSLEKMLRTDPIFTGAVPGTRGFDVTRVHLRTALHTAFDKTGRCDLYTILWEGRPAGVFSAHDLSSGIGYHYFPGCRGPLPEDARQVAMNVFLSAFGKKIGATTAQR